MPRALTKVIAVIATGACCLLLFAGEEFTQRSQARTTGLWLEGAAAASVKGYVWHFQATEQADAIETGEQPQLSGFREQVRTGSVTNEEWRVHRVEPPQRSIVIFRADQNALPSSRPPDPYLTPEDAIRFWLSRPRLRPSSNTRTTNVLEPSRAASIGKPEAPLELPSEILTRAPLPLTTIAPTDAAEPAGIRTTERGPTEAFQQFG